MVVVVVDLLAEVTRAAAVAAPVSAEPLISEAVALVRRT